MEVWQELSSLHRPQRRRWPFDLHPPSDSRSTSVPLRLAFDALSLPLSLSLFLSLYNAVDRDRPLGAPPARQLRGLPYMTSAEEEEGQEMQKIASKLYIFCRQRGGQKIPKLCGRNMWKPPNSLAWRVGQWRRDCSSIWKHIVH